MDKKPNSVVVAFPKVGKFKEPVDINADATIETEIQCLHCKNVWSEEVPAGMYDGHMCPNCELHKGVFKYILNHAEGGWECSCGSPLFALVNEDGSDEAMCVVCGLLHTGFNTIR